MWDDDGNEALFDQSGNFRDQEDFERFVEEYRPPSSLHPDEIDDVANTFNVDFERIGNTYLGAGRYLFKTDFEARISRIWHSWGASGMQTFKPSVDPLVRALIQDYYRQTDSVYGNGHPETCGCPECELLYIYPEYMVRSLPPEGPVIISQPDSTDTAFHFSSMAAQPLSIASRSRP